MAQQGWIKIHRKLRECYIWDDKEPFDKRSAWIDLLLSANHADKKTLINNQAVLVKRGSFITSEVKLSERWKWDRGKVRRFLSMLQKDNMIIKTATSRLYITVSIVNYDIYQSATSEDVETTNLEPYNTASNEQVTNKDSTSNAQVTNINKNDKECNKNSKNEKKDIIGDFTANEILKETIKDFMQMRVKIKKPMTEKALKLMLSKLNELTSNDNEKIQILNNSIENSWQGIFPLKSTQVVKKGNFNNFSQRNLDPGIEQKLREKSLEDTESIDAAELLKQVRS
jgi:hypothetical protein